MSVSTVSAATTTATTTSSSSSSSSSSSLSTEDFLSLLVTQLQNQNPLDPTDPDKMLDQMISFASYQQQGDMTSTLSTMSDTLSSVSDTLDAVASSLDISV